MRPFLEKRTNLSFLFTTEIKPSAKGIFCFALLLRTNLTADELTSNLTNRVKTAKSLTVNNFSLSHFYKTVRYAL